MLKIQCQCGHRMAVPDGYAGKRVKCAKCKGAVTVPGAVARAPVTAAAPAAAAIPVAMSKTASAGRVHRSRRHALERKQKSHNVTVAIIAGVMVVLGLGLLLFIGSMNRPVDPPAPQVAVNSSTGDKPQSPSGVPTIQKNKAASSDAAAMAGGADGVAQTVAADDGVTIAGQRFTAGSAAPAIAGTTSTFDAENNVTTITTAAPLPFTVDGRTMQMTMIATHDGRDVRQATQIGALVRITGDFTGLIAGANTDDPRLTIEADGRAEFFLPPVNRGESDDRKGVNGVEVLPKWVEFSMGMAELKAIAQAKSLRTTLGGTIFDLTKEQKMLYQSLVPGGAAASSTDDAPAPIAEVPEMPQPEPVVEDEFRADKKEMDEKEMTKKK